MSNHPFTNYTSPSAWIHECLAPLVVVSSTSDVDTLFATHKFTNLAEFLAPFGSTMLGKSVVVRDTLGNQHTLDSFPLRFSMFQDYVEMQNGAVKCPGGEFVDAETATAMASRLVQHGTCPEGTFEQGETQGDTLRPLKPDFIVPHANLEQATPWFSEFRNAICKYFPVAEHETFNHPVACILACTTTNPDILQAYSALYTSVVGGGMWIDPGMARVHLLVWDASGPTPEDEYVWLGGGLI